MFELHSLYRYEKNHDNHLQNRYIYFFIEHLYEIKYDLPYILKIYQDPILQRVYYLDYLYDIDDH